MNNVLIKTLRLNTYQIFYNRKWRTPRLLSFCHVIVSFKHTVSSLFSFVFYFYKLMNTVKTEKVPLNLKFKSSYTGSEYMCTEQDSYVNLSCIIFSKSPVGNFHFTHCMEAWISKHYQKKRTATENRKEV